MGERGSEEASMTRGAKSSSATQSRISSGEREPNGKPTRRPLLRKRVGFARCW